MLNFRCNFVPKYVYAEDSAFSDDLEMVDDKVKERLKDLAESVERAI